MNIGIISMQRVKNYGSLLQAYALKQLLEQRGHSVKFIDFKLGENAVHLSCYSKLKIKLNKLRLIDKYLGKRIEYSKKNKQLNRLFVIYQKDLLNIDEYKYSTQNMDAVIIGSDEIFNCSSKSDIGIDGQRFGAIKDVGIVASYAASCGATCIKDTSLSDQQKIKSAFANMTAISVRDNNTFEFVKEITGKEPNLNLDPVLIYDYQKECTQLRKQKGEIIRSPYMIVYSYHNRINDKSEIDAITSYAKKNKLTTIAIGASLPWCDEFVLLEPFEVLEYFRNAACIVTDTFHGTVIAAKYNKPMAVFIRNSNENKLKDLTNRLEIQSKVIKRAIDIEKVLDDTEFSYQACNAIINKGRKDALYYFDNIGL